jgi:hypothetical protein
MATALKSRTETDARKEDSVIFVLISRTNFSTNFVRGFKYKIPGFKCRNDAIKSRKIIENKEAPVRDLAAARHRRSRIGDYDLPILPTTLPP